MDYGKKYDDALERARKIHNEIVNNEVIGFPGQITDIFPELRESEDFDEKVRKWLVDYFSSIKETVWIHRDITCGQILAWLEKQKEQKPELVQQPPITYTYNSNASRDERLKAALLALLNSDLLKVKEGGYFTKQDLIEWVERIPTDKPTENDCQFIDEWFMETDFWKQYVKDSIIPGSEPTQQDIDFLLPQAKNLFALATKDMCNGCKDWSRGYNAGLANAEKEKSVIVIKQEYDSHSIVTRDAVSVKPAEWSEEDEMMRQGCIDSVKYELLDNGMDDEVETDPRIAWLKSLRPSWKPSEEQMEALEHFIRSWGESGTMSPQNTILCAATSLLTDLKNYFSL